MPGGFGTLDEFSELLTLIQTNKMSKIPIVLFGKEFYKPLIELFDNMEKMNYINKEDKNLYLLTDDVDETIDYIIQNSLLLE